MGRFGALGTLTRERTAKGMHFKGIEATEKFFEPCGTPERLRSASHRRHPRLAFLQAL
jgi:hypothetical protein